MDFRHILDFVDEEVELPMAMYTQAHVNGAFWKGVAIGCVTMTLIFTAIGMFL